MNIEVGKVDKFVYIYIYICGCAHVSTQLKDSATENCICKVTDSF